MEAVDRHYRAGDISIAYSETESRREPECRAATTMSAPGGRTFVLVHGIGMGRGVFAQTARILSMCGRVIALDLPGFGDSPRSKTAVTIEQNADVVAQFIASNTTGPLTLVGHSMGTQVVAEIALRYPKRVDTLVLIAPTVDRHGRHTLTQIRRMLQDLADDSLKVLFVGLWQYLKSNPVAFVKRFTWMMRHHLEDICPRITTPTLVIRGVDDRVCPHRWTAEVAAAFPNGRLREIADHGHEAVIDDAEPASQMILEFIAAHGRD